MNAQDILKIAGVKSEAELYKKFPTHESFLAKHGKALRKAEIGASMDKNSPVNTTQPPIDAFYQGQGGLPTKDITDKPNFQGFNPMVNTLGIPDYNMMMNPAAANSGKGNDMLKQAIGKTNSPNTAKKGKKVSKLPNGGLIGYDQSSWAPDIDNPGTTSLPTKIPSAADNVNMAYGMEDKTAPDTSNLPTDLKGGPDIMKNLGGIQGIGSDVGKAKTGPTGSQQLVSKAGPWGAAIGTISQNITGLTNQSNNKFVSTAGTAIFDPAAQWFNKDLSAGEKVWAGLEPISGGILAARKKAAKREQAGIGHF